MRYVGRRMCRPSATESCRMLCVLPSCYCSPCAVALLAAHVSSVLSDSTKQGQEFAAVADAYPMCCRSDPEHVPLMECGTGVALGPGLLSLMGFVMGVMWIDTIAGEVVGVLSFLAG